MACKEPISISERKFANPPSPHWREDASVVLRQCDGWPESHDHSAPRWLLRIDFGKAEGEQITIKFKSTGAAPVQGGREPVRPGLGPVVEGCISP